jgi:inhibitor of the pro-sigma K processing machinery
MPGGVDLSVVLAYTVGLIVLYLLFRLLWAPAKVALRCVYAMGIGLAVIVGANLVGHYVAFHLPLNPFSMLTIGFLGLPGVLLVVAVGRLF